MIRKKVRKRSIRKTTHKQRWKQPSRKTLNENSNVRTSPAPGTTGKGSSGASSSGTATGGKGSSGGTAGGH